MTRALVIVAIVFAGCGGGPSEDAAVRHTVTRWASAVRHHDSGAACAELTTQLRAAIDRHLLGEGVKGSCRTWAARWVSPRHPASRSGARLGSVRISGARATVSLSAPGGPDGHAQLAKQGGRWRIDDF